MEEKKEETEIVETEIVEIKKLYVERQKLSKEDREKTFQEFFETINDIIKTRFIEMKLQAKLEKTKN